MPLLGACIGVSFYPTIYEKQDVNEADGQYLMR